MFVLVNKENKKKLQRPKGKGMWFTTSKDEAEEMLRLCHDYLKSANLKDLIEKIVIEEEDV